MFPEHSSTKILDKSWMSNIPDERFLNEMTIPGTHDSCANNLVADLIEVFGKTQNCYIAKQLEIGIRLFDLRITYEKSVKGNLTISHALFVCRNKKGEFLSFSEDVIGDIEKFLQENPTETVLIALGYEDGDKIKYSEQMLEWWKTAKDKKTADGKKDLFYYENRVPKMGEVRGQIVIIHRRCFHYGLDEWSDLTDKIGIYLFCLDSAETNDQDYLIENHYDAPPAKKRE